MVKYKGGRLNCPISMKTFKQFTTSANGSLKNIHMDHPEDSILMGDLSVLNWFTAESKISAKIDAELTIISVSLPAFILES